MSDDINKLSPAGQSIVEICARGLTRDEVDEFAVLANRNAGSFAAMVQDRVFKGTARQIALELMAIARSCDQTRGTN